MPLGVSGIFLLISVAFDFIKQNYSNLCALLMLGMSCLSSVRVCACVCVLGGLFGYVKMGQYRWWRCAYRVGVSWPLGCCSCNIHKDSSSQWHLQRPHTDCKCVRVCVCACLHVWVCVRVCGSVRVSSLLCLHLVYARRQRHRRRPRLTFVTCVVLHSFAGDAYNLFPFPPYLPPSLSITHLLPARDRQVKVSLEPSLLAASQSFISLLFIYLTNGIICCSPSSPLLLLYY